MRVMVFIKADPVGTEDMAPTPERIAAFEAMDRFTEELVAAGVFVAAAGLKPVGEGRRVAVNGDARTVIDTPVIDPRATIAGFSIWQVRDMEEAVAWARRCPNTLPGPSEIEIRPFYEVADLTDFITPEERATPRDGTRGQLGVA